MINCPTCGSLSYTRRYVYEDDVSYVQVLENNIVIDPKRDTMRFHSTVRVILKTGEYLVTYDRVRDRFARAGSLPKIWRPTILESIRSLLPSHP